MIQLENLGLQFGTREIFRGVNTTIHDGEVVGIIGPSGSGKSQLLRCMTMLQKPTSGRILLDGVDLTAPSTDLCEARKKIGMVFQNFNLFQHMTVVENVMSGLVDLKNVPQETAYGEAMELIKTVGLSDKAYFYPYKLSGGQQQRAAIARTLAMKPELILLDEPTSSLDPLVRGEVEAVIRMLAAKGHTMVIVTHEMELVRQICTRVLFVNKGGIYEEGTPEKIFDAPERTGTRRFVQALRVLEFDVQSKDFDFIGTQTTITEFAYRNGMSKSLVLRLQSITEELFDMVIIQPKEHNKMHVSFEYNNKEKSLEGVIRFSGPKVDPDDPMYFFSWPIIVMRASEVAVEEIQDGDYTNKVTMKIKE